MPIIACNATMTAL